MKRWLLPSLTIVVLVGAWQVATSTGVIASALNLESFLVPSPAEIASSLWDNRSLLAENAWVTLREILIGLGCALVAGLGLALVLHLSENLRRALYPLLVSTQAIPVVVVAPILVVWFGYGILPKVLIVALVCFFPIVVGALDGLRIVDPDAVKLMRTLDASRAQIFRRVEIPTALPSTFSGAKIAAAVAPIGALFGELAGSSSGLGHLIVQDNAQLEVARLFASVVVLATIGIALFGLTALAERFVVTWR